MQWLQEGVLLLSGRSALLYPLRLLAVPLSALHVPNLPISGMMDPYAAINGCWEDVPRSLACSLPVELEAFCLRLNLVHDCLLHAMPTAGVPERLLEAAQGSVQGTGSLMDIFVCFCS